jgi:hypothetical protein
MRKLLIFLLVLVVAVAALGYYRGWFQVSTAQGPEGKTENKVVVDPAKVKSDVTGAQKRALEAVGKGTSKEGQK